MVFYFYKPRDPGSKINFSKFGLFHIMAHKKNKKPAIVADLQVSYKILKKKPKLAEIYKDISISTSEKEDEGNLIYSLSLTPGQRLAYLRELNRIAFGELSKEQMWERFTKKIIIRKLK